MPTFRWPDTNHDIALAKEVVSSRPTKPLDWDLIASNLNMAFSTEDTQVYLKGRGCKERMERLLNKFKIEDTTSLRRRGTEEEYSELMQLLEDISSYMGDLATLQKKVRDSKNKDDKQKAKEIKAVMEKLLVAKRKRQRDEACGSPGLDTSSSSVESEDDVVELGLAMDDRSKKAKHPKGESSNLKRASKVSAVEMLEQRFIKKAELKEKELELRRMELELQKKKVDGEEEERKQRLQLELEERRALLELLKKHL